MYNRPPLYISDIESVIEERFTSETAAESVCQPGIQAANGGEELVQVANPSHEGMCRKVLAAEARARQAEEELVRVLRDLERVR